MTEASHHTFTKTDCPEGCPGCARQKMTTRQCLAEKLGFAQKTLAPWQPVLAGPETAPEQRQWEYRNKVCLSAIHDGAAWHIGLKRRNAVIAVDRCRIHSTGVRDAMALFADILPPAPWFPLVFYVQSNAQITLVVKSARMPEMEWLTGDVKNGYGVDRLIPFDFFPNTRHLEILALLHRV